MAETWGMEGSPAGNVEVRPNEGNELGTAPPGTVVVAFIGIRSYRGRLKQLCDLIGSIYFCTSKYRSTGFSLRPRNFLGV